jgi:Berberine and berberine like
VPFSTGVYVNHLGMDEPEHVWAVYDNNYARLVEVKQKHDPINVFRLDQNIKPTV